MPWWRRPVEISFGRAGAVLIIGLVVELVSNPWLAAVLAALIAAGALFALLLRRLHRDESGSTERLN